MKCHTTLLKNSRKTLVNGEQNDDPYSKPVLCPIVISRFFLRCQCPQFLCSFRRQNSKTLNYIYFWRENSNVGKNENENFNYIFRASVLA